MHLFCNLAEWNEMLDSVKYLFYRTAQKQVKIASHLRIIALDWM